MIGIFRLFVVAASVIAGVAYFLKNIVYTTQWRKGISQSDLDLLKASMSDLHQNLIELDKEELKLLSLNKELKKIRKSGKKINAGVFFSIYNEPLLNFATLEFDQYRKLVLISTADQDFIYRVGTRSTDIYCNENLIGSLNNVGKLISPVTKKTLMSIENQIDTKFQRIQKNDKEIAAILNPLLVDSPNQRVVQYEELENDSDRILALSLVFLNMIERS